MDTVAPALRCTLCDSLLLEAGAPRDGATLAALEAAHYAEQHPLPAQRSARTSAPTT